VRALPVLVLAACGGHSLSELGGTVVSISARQDQPGQPALVTATFATPNCDAFADDLAMTFAGHALVLAAQPTEETVDGIASCVQGMTNTLTLPQAVLRGEPMTLSLADSTATWTISFPGLYDGDLVPRGPVVADQTATFGWTDGPPIMSACFSYVSGTELPATASCFPQASALDTATLDRASNTFSVDLVPWRFPVPGTITAWAVGTFDVGAVPWAPYSANAVRCDGPAGCSIELSVATTVTIQP
jgi:hypothetical protein